MDARRAHLPPTTFQGAKVMADPKLKKVAVQIRYWSSDGYKADLMIKAGEGTHNLKTGDPVPSEKGLLSALDESLRLLTLFGFEDQADATIADVKQRMAKWKESRAASLAQAGEGGV
jgi:hypothetical protein